MPRYLACARTILIPGSVFLPRVNREPGYESTFSHATLVFRCSNHGVLDLKVLLAHVKATGVSLSAPQLASLANKFVWVAVGSIGV